MISKEEVLHIAKLARLQLNEIEVEKMQKDLSSILDYFDLLKKAPTVKAAKIEGRAMFSELEKVTRKDVVLPKPTSLANNLVQAAPQQQEEYIKVKQIF
jgi:aspartyl-tRNA(Asn)/glutamyl-tRNA(Gln) amidotransferase subunit C